MTRHPAPSFFLEAPIASSFHGQAPVPALVAQKKANKEEKKGKKGGDGDGTERNRGDASGRITGQRFHITPGPKMTRAARVSLARRQAEERKGRQLVLARIAEEGEEGEQHDTKTAEVVTTVTAAASVSEDIYNGPKSKATSKSTATDMLSMMTRHM